MQTKRRVRFMPMLDMAIIHAVKRQTRQQYLIPFRESFEAINENHALCLAVLMANYLKKHGHHFRVGHFRLYRKLLSVHVSFLLLRRLLGIRRL
jgi:hypothetical protein